MIRSLGIALLVLMCSLATMRSAEAQQFRLFAEDLEIRGTYAWTGSGWGGYQPVRLEVSNGGAARDLTFRITSSGEGRLPTVRRRLPIDRRATARLVMLVPIMSGYHTVHLEVLVDGARVPGLQSDLSLIGRSVGPPPSVSLVYVSSSILDDDDFELGASRIGPNWRDSTPSDQGYRFNGPRPGGMSEERPQSASVSPETLPDSWMGYSGADVVAIEWATLGELAAVERRALLDWVATGGRLVVHDAGKLEGESAGFRERFGTWEWHIPASSWSRPDSRNRVLRVMPWMLSMDEASRREAPSEGSPFGGFLGRWRDRFQEERPPGPVVITASWPGEPVPFLTGRHVFGRIAVVSADLADANPADWNFLLTELGGPAMTWPMRHGLDSGAGDMEFINLPIPGVRGVPTIAFLVLISLFAIVIGPVNYILLWRSGRLSRLVITVPLLAVATSLMLFAYGALAHGFGTKGRIRSVSWIDTETNSATTLSRMALFAGMAPSEGMRFSPETAVYPLMPIGERFSGGTIDWTDQQALTDGFLPTRTRTQFVTVSRRDERGRLRVRQTEGGLTVVNGFTVELEHLIVNDARGRPYYGHDLAAGGTAQLAPLTDEARAAMRELAIERIPEPPEGLEPQELVSALGDSFRRRRAYQWRPQMRDGLLERHIALVGSTLGTENRDEPRVPAPERSNRIRAALQEDIRDPLAQSRGFLAVTTQNPGIDVGGLEIEEFESLHVMMGRW